MNEVEQAELERLKERIAAMRRDLDVVWAQAQQLEARALTARRLSVPESQPAVAAGAVRLPASLGRPAEATLRIPPPLPPELPKVAGVIEVARIVEPLALPTAGETGGGVAPRIPVVLPPVAGSSEAAAGSEAGSLEMRVGTYWLVRVGVVMMLTAMVFFARYAYQNFIVQLGPGGKLALMYAVSAVLLGLGRWLEGRQATLKNYAQVLFAGGLAAVYFTTYAAHHLAPLRVVESPVVDGVLLLLWAGVMVGIAERRKSELLCLFAVGLAYYTSVVTRVGTFTLYSNLVLALASVVFLVRNRWATVSVFSLTASYGAYAFWRFFHGGEWHWATPGEGLWEGAWFLAAYWAVFTVGVFFARHERLAGPGRVGFLSFNNLAFYGMFLLTMAQVREGGFWRFSLIFGGVLLGCASLASRFLGDDPPAWQGYAAQGLLLATVGLIARFTGPELALVLAVQSVVLLMLAHWRSRRLFAVAAHIAGLLGALFAVGRWGEGTAHLLALGGGTAFILLAGAAWSAHCAAADDRPMRPEPLYFGVLGLFTGVVSLIGAYSGAELSVVLVGVGLALTLLVHVLPVRELACLAQGYVILGLGGWAVQAQASGAAASVLAGWPPVALAGMALFLAHWWQRQRVVSAGDSGPYVTSGFYSLGLVVVLLLWVPTLMRAEAWMVMAAVLAVGATAYAVATRLWMLGAVGQLFLVAAIVGFVRLHVQGWLGWTYALIPGAALAGLSWAAVEWFRRGLAGAAAVKSGVLGLAQAYRWLALILALAWVQLYLPRRDQTWVLMVAATVVFVGCVRRANLEGILFSAVVGGCGLGLWWFGGDAAEPVRWVNLVAILTLPVLQPWARRQTARCRFEPEWLGAMVVVGGVSLWWYVTRWVGPAAGGFYLTAAWAGSAFVLFVTGLTLQERLYRWLGLAVLGLALGRVVVFDVWKLETLYRILSFVAIGVVLMLLGYCYNRYQDRIRQWL